MKIVIKPRKAPAPPPVNDRHPSPELEALLAPCTWGNERLAEARADIDALHAHKVTAEALRAKWGLENLSLLTSWAYRPGTTH